MHTNDGTSRHLMGGTPDEAIEPLLTKFLREKKNIPEQILKLLNDGQSVDISKNVDNLRFVRDGPTRISRIIKNRIKDVLYDGIDSGSKSFVFPSPLSIIQDFLTIPDHPGSKAFSFITLRTILFEKFGVVPSDLGKSAYDVFTNKDIETAYDQISTSHRPRFRSKGQDKLPANLGSKASGMLRQFLSMNGYLNLRFTSVTKFRQFVLSDDFYKSKGTYEYSRPKYLKSLPDLSEVINTLWGLPLPIRGADTIFRGGLMFSTRGGAVCAVHGGAGAGKTSLSLGLGAALSAFGIKTIFFTAEEDEDDLRRRALGLLPEEIRRLPFIKPHTDDWLLIEKFKLHDNEEGRPVERLRRHFQQIQLAIEKQNDLGIGSSGVPMPCTTIVVFDGLHDLARKAMTTKAGETLDLFDQNEFHLFIETCRKLNALVILTTGVDWDADLSLDYLVDVAMHLSIETDNKSGAKPHRYLTLSKARHQLCSLGTHGLQIAGHNGVRFTPQINYQLDRRAIWSTRLPNMNVYKDVMRRRCKQVDLKKLPDQPKGRLPKNIEFTDKPDVGVSIFRGSNVFINGEGSGGKAGLALKIATAPSFSKNTNEFTGNSEKILIVSFLYSIEYYNNIHDRLKKLRDIEYPDIQKAMKSRLHVIQLYPGHLMPDVLFSKIEWALRSASLMGDPYTTIIIDGIHNVFLQFPEIEENQIFWSQLFSSLRTREIDIVLTHTILSLGRPDANKYVMMDDKRSDPLRHALVMKTDFRFEVDPRGSETIAKPGDWADIQEEHSFVVETQSAIGQSLPSGRSSELYWSRERLVFFSENQGGLRLKGSQSI